MQNLAFELYQAQAPQPSYVYGLEEASLYHEADSRGFLAVCTEDAFGKFNQWCVRPRDLEAYLLFIEADTAQMNVWISMGEFSAPNRRMVNLVRMGLCFLDLDTYKSEAKDWSRQQILDKIHELCHTAGIPSPSLIIYSGRGYQIKWLLSSYLPYEALPRWNVLQGLLLKIFAPLGADPAAKDASRILRLVGTTNLKSGEKVEVVYHQGSSLDTTGAVNFEDLAKALMPLDRQRKPTAKSLAKATGNGGLSLVASNTDSKNLHRRIHSGTLAWARLRDLRTLAAMRGGIGEGMRNSYLLVTACQMALCGMIYPAKFTQEVRALQAEISKDPQWLRDTSLLGSLQTRVDAHSRKEKYEYNGKEVTPIYTYRTSTIINLLSITRAEQEQLKTLISKEVAQERDTLRTRTKRRAAGVKERSEYLAGIQDKHAQAVELKAQGLSVTAIAERLGMSRPTVYTALKNAKV
jgi:DNA-binding CsgD family transcriptional regulator